MTALPLDTMGRELGQISTCVQTRVGDPVIIWDVIGNVIYGKIGNYARQWQLSGHSPEHKGHDIVPIPPATPEPTISDEDVRTLLFELIDDARTMSDEITYEFDGRALASKYAVKIARTKLAPRGLSEAAERLYEFVRAEGIHGSDAKPWAKRSPEHRELWKRAILAAGPVERATEVKAIAPKILTLIREYPDRFRKQTTVKEICRELWQEALDLCASLGMRDGSEDGPCASYRLGPATPNQTSCDPAVDRQAAPVAWLLEWASQQLERSLTLSEQTADVHKHSGATVTPLYTAPPATQKPSDDVVALLRECRVRVIHGFDNTTDAYFERKKLLARIDAILVQAATP